MTSSDNEKPPQPRLPEVVLKIYDLLEPFDAAARGRAIKSALAMFPDETPMPPGVMLREPVGSLYGERPGGPGDQRPGGPGERMTSDPPTSSQEPSRYQFGKRAQIWLRRHGLTDEILERVFHMTEDGDVELIAAVEGGTRREQTTNCYLLTGVMGLLRRDDPKFTETDAIALCKVQSCYDQPNHAQTRQTFGNRIHGNKGAGYTLPTPGLDAAAQLIRTLAGA